MAVYQFATAGGVERVLLNRAITLSQSDFEISLDVHFIRNYGGLKPMYEAIDRYKIHNYLRVVDSPRLSDYDYIDIIDSPEIFEFVPAAVKLFVECHTSRFLGQEYLRSMPKTVKAVAVPSESTALQVRRLTDVPVRIVPNRVPTPGVMTLQALPWPVMFYVGRIEMGKNTEEAVQIFASALQSVPDLRMIIISPSVDRSLIKETAEKLGVRDRILHVGALSFVGMNSWLQRLAAGRSVFVSSSRHETWGLAAAEALSFGIPVVLANNSGHSEVVKGSSSLLYALGNVQDGAGKVASCLLNPLQIKPTVEKLRDFHVSGDDTIQGLRSIFELM
ncbi:glycosyltransferase [Methylobacterium sp. SD21]|uniref:glycosyltransferase n=1 Tax=Methylobacterium litchii TaxID=3138810 RepID=UPI00313B1F68